MGLRWNLLLPRFATSRCPLILLRDGPGEESALLTTYLGKGGWPDGFILVSY